jgi:hypothetical protein
VQKEKVKVDLFRVEILERKDLYFCDMKQNFRVLNGHHHD